MSSLRKKPDGFSMVEVLVALAIVTVGAYALLNLVGTQQKNMKNTEQKVSAQNLVQNITLSISDVEECRVTLDLDAIPITFPKVSLPGQEHSTATEMRWPLPKLVIPGVRTIAIDDEFEGLTLKSANLVFLNPMTTGGLKYLADLEVVLAKKNPSASLGATEFKRHIPLRTTFSVVNPTTLLLSECYGGSVDDPQVMCEKMGGRWLSSTNNTGYSMKSKCSTTHLQKERCVMDSSFVLGRDELADNIPCDGGANDDGERAEECYYQTAGSTVIRTSLCPSYDGIRNGARCHFDLTTKRWGMWNFRNGIAKSLKYRCDKGVKISTKASSTNQLAWNERLYLATSNTAPSDNDASVEYSGQEQLSLQESVEKCFYESDSDAFVACKNTTTAESGYIGAAGSCIYAKGITLTNSESATSKRIARCNAATTDPAECPGGITNYTGWIRVTSGYGRKIGSNILTEARGIPCFRVEVNSSLARTPTEESTEIMTPYSELPTADIKNAPTQIRHCEFRSSLPPNRKSLQPCANETAGMTGEDYDYTGYNATGTANDVESKLDKNTCWYFKNVAVKGVLGAYTGWIRLTEALPNWGQFDLLPDNSMQRKSTSIYVIKGEICNKVYLDATAAAPE